MKSATRVKFWARMALLGLFLALLIGVAWQPVEAQTGAKYKTVMYFFWGDGCPHCAAAKPWLEEVKQSHPELEVRAYEIWNSDANRQLFIQMADYHKVGEPRGVPTFFMGDEHWAGYNETLAANILTSVEQCISTGCADAGAGIMPGASDEPPQQLSPAQQPGNPQQSGNNDNTPGQSIEVPLIGEVDLSHQSLFVSTLLISFVDGFNPCSLWVLSMLLALTLHTGDRKKVAIIGLIFLTVTAGVYALFIAGLFTVLTIVSFVGWIQLVVALVSAFFGLVNMKDYFWYKEGLSFTIADEKKPGIYKSIRRVMDASQSFWGMAGATVVMAAGVSLVEFSCTAGFPVLWTNLVSAQKVPAAVFALLLLTYMIIYQLDELAIFFTAVFTLKASKVQEKQGRILKLIGGTLMLVLAGVMIFNPYLMNNLTSSLIIFGFAFGLAMVILLVHRVILPAFGIWIGTKEEDRKTGG